MIQKRSYIKQKYHCMSNMKKHTLFHLALIFFLVIGFSSCKSKKKIADVSDATMVTDQAENESVEEELPPPVEEEEPTPSPPVKSEPTASEKLEDHLLSIANASNANMANQSIQQALTMFSSGDAPVLIIIYSGNGQVDYDEPTTISKYLNYVKDTGNANFVVEDMVKDPNGRIKELVLRKK